jgi:amino acid adenylation domain-containing protein
MTARPGSAALLPDLVDHWITRTPDAIAVRQEDDTRTYAELGALSTKVAAGLAGLGCGPESAVALLLERTVDLPAALLGVSRAGCGYVPLDPAHPPERLAAIVADSGAAVVITSGPPPDWLAGSAAKAVGLDELAGVGDPDLRGSGASHPDQVAYVLFTSGSTGRPKGVAVTHGGLANCLTSTRRMLRPQPGDRLLAVSTVSFDIATKEIFLPLVSGGEVVLTRAGESRDGKVLASLIERWRPRFMQATPPVWELLFLSGWPGDPDLVVMVGGDVVSRRLGTLLTACNDQVWHTYGPTETTMYSVCTRLTPGPQPPVLPVGAGIDNTGVHVVDERLAAVPPGTVGELCISGPGLARGYAGRPALTAERFVPSPVQPGERWYRTGDLARVRPDGALELCGRNDRQIKIRGHRIEPGEVEHVLGGHPDVARSAVVPAGGGAGEPKLCAFIQPHEPRESPAESRVLLAAVRSFAETRLPAAMTPSAFATLPALPLTPNGKVDRALLSRLTPPSATGAPPPARGAPVEGMPVLVIVTAAEPHRFATWTAATEPERTVRFCHPGRIDALGGELDGVGPLVVAGCGAVASDAAALAHALAAGRAEPPALLLVDPAPPDERAVAAGKYPGPAYHVAPQTSDRSPTDWRPLLRRPRVIRLPGDGESVIARHGARLAAVVAQIH